MTTAALDDLEFNPTALHPSLLALWNKCSLVKITDASPMCHHNLYDAYHKTSLFRLTQLRSIMRFSISLMRTKPGQTIPPEHACSAIIAMGFFYSCDTLDSHGTKGLSDLVVGVCLQDLLELVASCPHEEFPWFFYDQDTPLDSPNDIPLLKKFFNDHKIFRSIRMKERTEEEKARPSVLTTIAPLKEKEQLEARAKAEGFVPCSVDELKKANHDPEIIALAERMSKLGGRVTMMTMMKKD